MSNKKNERQPRIDDGTRLRTAEELKKLAEECIASGDKAKVLAGRIAKRAIGKATRTGWTDIDDALRAGSLVEEFADIIALDVRPQRWLLKAICQSYVEAIRSGRYAIDLGRHVPDEQEIAGLCEEFAAAGLNVTPEAIAHNVRAWKADMKSGFRGEDFFLFTPCGCNDLCLRAEPLQEGADWQTTYMA